MVKESGIFSWLLPISEYRRGLLVEQCALLSAIQAQAHRCVD